VSYMRDGMQELKSKEYETARYEYVESRRLNPDHPLQRTKWNGISEGMWAEDEWNDFLVAKGMIDEDGFVGNKKAEVSSLDEFF